MRSNSSGFYVGLQERAGYSPTDVFGHLSALVGEFGVQMETIQKYYRRLSELSKKDENLKTSHSIDEANEKQKIKTKKLNSASKGKPTAKSKNADKIKSPPQKKTD